MEAIDPQVHAPRFWSKVNVLDDYSCWEWVGSKDPKGYGKFTPRHGEQAVRAHRVAYFLWHGEDPGDMCVCHHCDNPPCCNPRHYFLGTLDDNNKDRHLKGRDHVTHGESHGRAKITWDDVELIRSSPISSRVLAERLGVCAGTVQKVRSGKTWRFKDNAAARALTSASYEDE